MSEVAVPSSLLPSMQAALLSAVPPAPARRQPRLRALLGLLWAEARFLPLSFFALQAGLLALALGSALWFPNLLEPAALWLDRTTAGALNLFALTRGSVAPLAQANMRQALAALALLALALLAPAAARWAAQRRAF